MEHLNTPECKGYVWVNRMIMSDKQCGIQTTHAITEMSVDHASNPLYQRWAKHDKTLLMFSGVNSGGLRRVHTILEFANRNLQKVGIELPLVMFKEDEETADGMTTAVGCVIPDAIRTYGFKEYIESPHLRQFDYDHHDRGQERNAAALGVYDTESYYKHVKWCNDLDAKARERLNNHPPYKYDKFYFAEFAAWLDTQKLA